MDAHPDTFALVQIHLDSYGTTWGNSRASFYGIQYTPTSWFDGVSSYIGAGSYAIFQNYYNSRRGVPTDVTIEAGGEHLSGETYRISATVCIEAGGQARTMKIYMAQVLDYWPIPPSYSRNGFVQAASTETVTLNSGQCQVIKRDFTFSGPSASNHENIKIIVWAQEPDGSGPAEVFQAAIVRWPFMLDCNDNSISDECDLDCELPDCDVPGCGQSDDCDADGTPDECQPDCNSNGVADPCDLSGGTSSDCQPNGTPDECEADCNLNGQPDDCDVEQGSSFDCNDNWIPDECELEGNDCNGNSTPDECDAAAMIIGEPSDVVQCEGLVAEFSVAASGADLAYQWYKDEDYEHPLANGGDISGADDATLIIANVESADGGGYSCVVTSDGCVESTSRAATLTVWASPQVTSHPVSAEVCEQSNAGFTSAFSGPGLGYQWEYSLEVGGPWEPIPGAVAHDVVVTATTLSDEGWYRCRGSNVCGDAYTNPAYLQVDAKPSIIQNPQNTCGEIGGMAVFTVDARTLGGDPYDFDYQWYHGSTPLACTDPVLILAVTSAADAGNYVVKVSSGPGCQRFSTAGVLQVGGCCPTPGDLDGDADVDLADYGRFQECYDDYATGECHCADMVNDGVIEMNDLGPWETELESSGPS